MNQIGSVDGLTIASSQVVQFETAGLDKTLTRSLNFDHLTHR